MNDALQAIFDEARANRVFPGGVAWLAHGDDVTHAAFGDMTYEATAALVTPDTLYDIASLTKLFTATAFLIAARQTDTPVDTPVARLLPAFDTSDKRAITLRHLLNHSSGLELAVQSLVREPPETWLARLAASALQAPPGARVLYTCSGYFVLGRAIERLAGQWLDEFITHQIIAPLGLERTTFIPLERFAREEIAPTEIDAATGQPWQGVVHDEAARAWTAAGGGCCGNAGLFGTAADMARFAQLWRDEGAAGGRQILHPDDARRALADTRFEGDGWRAWGWQVDRPFFMSEHAPPGSAGHTGFTGPTLWLHPAQRLIAVILNNRVYPTRHGPNRMEYHRRVAEWLMGGALKYPAGEPPLRSG